MHRKTFPAALIMFMGLLTTETSIGQIETLVMPGKVTEAHVELEAECKSCHVAFSRDKQRTLCLDCHEDVNADIESSAGFHGNSTAAREDRCSSCHTEHKGRDADIVGLNTVTFNHELTDFPLLGKHKTSECSACHEPELKYREAPSNCLACHESDNVHGDNMGVDCQDCHNPVGWDDVEFDHDLTGFSLVGKHNDAQCLDCHEDQTFQAAPADCFSCHAEDDAHNGKSGNECGNCHRPTGWDDTSFDHNRDTDFPLIGNHTELSCGDCHSDDPFNDEMQTSCVSCHLDDDNHDGHFGDACDTCHSPRDWVAVTFDHDIDTNHPLVGAHEAIECNACHVEPIFDVPLLGSCNDCHAEDDAHDGTLGIKCADCHNEESWQDKVFFDHDLTNFPLLGNHSEVECDACHTSHVFSDASTDCVSCHREDDPHKGNFDDQCQACHNPVDWKLWLFDHDVQTNFPLTGAHVDVSCSDCHRSPLKKMQAVGKTCGTCHRADDVHDGEFGLDCGRCHSADSFKEVRSLQ